MIEECEDSFLLVRRCRRSRDEPLINVNLQANTHFLLLISWNIHQKHLVHSSDSIALFAEGKKDFKLFLDIVLSIKDM